MDRAALTATPPSDEHLKHLERLVAQVEARLDELMKAEEGLRLEQAMRHCLFAGGKRLRPLLVLVTAQSLQVSAAQVMDVACAIEMVHSASLILDDLPCMDDASLRRGAASCHVEFGEDIAILAAVTLITRAFKVVAGAATLGADEKVAISDVLADALGSKGLAGGQEQDLRDMTDCADMDAVTTMEKRKTSALFVACMRSIAIMSAASVDAARALADFGIHLGLAFQIFDDLLDQLGTSESTGKDHAQDESRATFGNILKPEQAEQRARSELAASLQALKAAGVTTLAIESLVQSLFASYADQVR